MGELRPWRSKVTGRAGRHRKVFLFCQLFETLLDTINSFSEVTLVTHVDGCLTATWRQI